ncbi:hypothetical protein EMCRGX_G034367 [Ephydatia muelleri]|eukprot:Em0023g295a
MYSLSPRTFGQTVGSTAPAVGPGSYNIDARRLKQAYVPFSSVTPRESFLTISDQLAAVPGPGYYTPSIPFDKPRGGESVATKAARFVMPKPNAPDPGTYNLQSEWGDTMTHAHLATQMKTNTKVPRLRVSYYRQHTAPSIPSAGQNCGYDENNAGSLQPLDTPQRDATLGPAYYKVSYDETQATKKYKGVHFGALKSQRIPFQGKEGPAPGAYNIPADVEPSHSAQIVKRQSKLPRYYEIIPKDEEKKSVPGPGQYEIRSQFVRSPLDEEDDVEEIPVVPFGSTQQRFTSMKYVSPPCTKYNDPRSAFEGAQRPTGLRKVPFGQSSVRFREDRQGKSLPGPGTYSTNDANSLMGELTKKAVGHNVVACPFGSTSVRTVPLIKRDTVDLPGPAQYQQDDLLVTMTRRQKLSSCFASATKRLPSPPAIVTDIPPPGSYEVQNAFERSQGKVDMQKGAGKGAFLSSTERTVPPHDVLMEQPDKLNPGPGEYASEQIGKSGKLSLLCSREERFKNPKPLTPGPGAYEMSRSYKDTVLLGTFNANLENPLKMQPEKCKPSKQEMPIVVL